MTDLDRHIDAATQALLARQRADGHCLFELEADATIPAEYVLLRHYLGEPVDAALEAEIAAYLRRIQGAHGGWPLFPDGAFDMSATVKAYFALKMIGDSPQAEHMRRAREAIRAARRRRAQQRVHALSARAVRHRAVARGAGDAGRDHAVAEMVSVPSRQNLVLEPHRDRAAPGADGEEAARAQSERRSASTNCSSSRRSSSGRRRRRRSRKRRGSGSSASSTTCCVPPSRGFRKSCAQRAIDARRRLGSTERLNGEDGLGAIFPAMANSVMMFDALGIAGRRSAARHCAQIDRQAARGPRRRDLLPALRVADLGHRARLPCACSKPAASDAVAQAKRGLDWLVPQQVLDRARRLDRAAAERAAGRLGLSICQSALSRCRRHRGRGDGDGPHAEMRAIRRRSTAIAERSIARANGSSACRASTAAGARSMPTTNITISTTFRSPTTARCSIRRPRMSARAACRCWRSSATTEERRGRTRARLSAPHAACPTAPGTAAGA